MRSVTLKPFEWKNGTHLQTGARVVTDQTFQTLKDTRHVITKDRVITWVEKYNFNLLEHDFVS